ncbi:MAG: HEAT repeat domain-containing protein [Acidimicrobiales bacterium]
MAAGWPEAPRPSAAAVAEREAILAAAAIGDYEAVRARSQHRDDRVRATVFRVLASGGVLEDEEVVRGYCDHSARVRAAVAEIAASDLRVPLEVLLGDDAAGVVETACWASGERGTDARDAVPVLMAVSRDHDDPLCREAAVAALGAIGDVVALPAILEATKDKATVRRRAIIALAPFDSPEVTSTLRQALEDRDWQVRQAAEDLLAASE